MIELYNCVSQKLKLSSFVVHATSVTHATTGGRISTLPGVFFFVDSGKTASYSATTFGMTIPSSFLCTLRAGSDLLPLNVRSPGHSKLPDLTIHITFFSIFKPR